MEEGGVVEGVLGCGVGKGVDFRVLHILHHFLYHQTNLELDAMSAGCTKQRDNGNSNLYPTGVHGGRITCSLQDTNNGMGFAERMRLLDHMERAECSPEEIIHLEQHGNGDEVLEVF